MYSILCTYHKGFEYHSDRHWVIQSRTLGFGTTETSTRLEGASGTNQVSVQIHARPQ